MVADLHYVYALVFNHLAELVSPSARLEVSMDLIEIAQDDPF